MCRLLGLLGGSPGSAEEWLVRSPRSLLAQSNVTPDTAQKDGWGIAWSRPGAALHLERGVGGAYEPGEVDRFRAAAAAARGTVTLGHLRHASNPMNLPRGRLIGVENSQPFAEGAWVFAHNGMIPLPRETRPKLGDLEKRIHGVNDSEVFFVLLQRELAQHPNPPEAYGRAVAELLTVWEEQGRPTPEPYSGLNLVLSGRPDELWVLCHWRGEHGSGLLDAGRPYYQMTYRADAQHLLAGSEPFDTGPGWRSIGNGEWVHGRLEHGLVAVETGRIPLPPPPAPQPAAVRR